MMVMMVDAKKPRGDKRKWKARRRGRGERKAAGCMQMEGERELRMVDVTANGA